MRHLNDPKLLIWVAQCGGQLHDRWLWLIENQLNDFSSKEGEGKTAEVSAQLPVGGEAGVLAEGRLT